MLNILLALLAAIGFLLSLWLFRVAIDKSVIFHFDLDKITVHFFKNPYIYWALLALLNVFINIKLALYALTRLL